MRVNVQQEIPDGMCADCGHVSRLKFENGGGIVRCSVFERIIHGKVESCTAYTKRGAMSLWDMKQVATIIEIELGGGIGFIRPDSDRHKQYRDKALMSPFGDD